MHQSVLVARALASAPRTLRPILLPGRFNFGMGAIELLCQLSGLRLLDGIAGVQHNTGLILHCAAAHAATWPLPLAAATRWCAARTSWSPAPPLSCARRRTQVFLVDAFPQSQTHTPEHSVSVDQQCLP